MRKISTLFAKVRFDTDLCLDIVPKVWYNRLVPKILEVFIVAIKWSYKEDYIVCKFYLNHVDDWKENLDCLMMELIENGFEHRVKESARMRVQNYESLHTGKGLSNAAQQSRDIYSAMIRRKQNPESYQLLRSCLESVDLGDLLNDSVNLNCYLRVETPAGENFYDVFWKFFMDSGLTDPEVYNSCNMGRDTFWRIANKKNDGINKKTAVQLCFGLKLSYEDSLVLLDAAGYTLSKGIMFDHVVATYLKCKNYDVNDVNLTLEENNVPSSLYLLPKNRRSKEDK